jgi:antitoxin (DNA-binding transcriptional repressor) of toxin-antitoxin stability system
MQASVVNMRYNMRDILRALDRNEKVTITYHGKAKGIIIPVEHDNKNLNMRDHLFCQMRKDETSSVEETMETLRGGRYSDI